MKMVRNCVSSIFAPISLAVFHRLRTHDTCSTMGVPGTSNLVMVRFERQNGLARGSVELHAQSNWVLDIEDEHSVRKGVAVIPFVQRRVLGVDRGWLGRQWGSEGEGSSLSPLTFLNVGGFGSGTSAVEVRRYATGFGERVNLCLPADIASAVKLLPFWEERHTGGVRCHVRGSATTTQYMP
ncbi:hypothetical protein B0H16DRAFT_496006 [Mycena metata]|uniref:Uncharacterized protein n=1 Tax=Mycena metata TaxID=1033252 RepID=A0AAD7H9R7_9AGAR|nr:hypothetical protein B0H16DRAFT_496006 [Mycena metata]